MIKCSMGLYQGEGFLICCVCSEETYWKIQSPKYEVVFIFVDLEKDFDQVPRELIYFAVEVKGCHRTFVRWGYVSL